MRESKVNKMMLSTLTHSPRQDNTEALKLMTIHKSKGLEWAVVFVVKMNEGELPSCRSEEELGANTESAHLQKIL